MSGDAGGGIGAAVTETEARPRGPRISLDFVLENCHRAGAGIYNPYIRTLCQMDWMQELLELTHTSTPVKQLMNHKHLKKEMTESFSAIRLAERAMRRRDRRLQYSSDLSTFEALREHQDKLVFYDMCCGKGLLSFLLTFLFPSARIKMVDHNRNMNMQYLSVPRFRNTEFVLMDLFLDDSMRRLQAEMDGFEVNGNIVFAFGLHLCGHLSSRLVSCFNDISSLSALVLSPCCMPARRKGGEKIRDMLRKTNWSGYEYWCFSVFSMVDRALAWTDIVRDDYVESDKSTTILAIKKNEADVSTLGL